MEDAIRSDAASVHATASDSVIDLTGESGGEIPELPVSTGSDSSIDLGGELGSSVDVPESSKRPSDSVIDLAADALAGSPMEGAESAVELPADAVVEEGDEIVELAGDDLLEITSGSGDSGIDLAADPRVGTGSKPSLAPGESGIDLIAEDVILETSRQSALEGGSKRDLIAEGLESGVDLMGTGKKRGPGEERMEDFLAQVEGEDPSSSVDLGSTHNIDMFKEEELAGSRPGAGQAPIDLDDLERARAGDFDQDDIDSANVDLGAAAPAEAADEAFDEVDLGEPEPEVAEEEEPAAAPVKERGRAGAWVGGTVVGALVGTAACLGLWVGGVEPPSSLREMVGTAPAKRVEPQGAGAGSVGKGGPTGTTPAAGFGQAAERIRSGELDKVNETDLAAANENDATHLVARAEYRWLSYLKSQRGKNLSADADPVKKALTDLDKAIAQNNADALFLRGQIRELTGNVQGALADYKEGAAKFKADPVQGPRFEAAQVVLETAAKVAHLAPPGMAPRQLALILIALQPPMPQGGDKKGVAPADQGAVPDEAGLRFWQAIRSRRQDKYDEAIKALDEARARHDQRRYLTPRKPQNPLSDPREEIFLRACDELKAYWTLLARLNSKDYFALDAKDRVPAVDALLQKAEDRGRVAVVKDLGEKLLKDKAVASAEAVVKRIGDERKAAKDRETKLDEAIGKQKKEIVGLSDKLKDTESSLTKTSDELKTSVAREKELKAGIDAANAALSEVASVVKVKFTDLKTSKEPLLAQVRESLRVANLKDPEGTIRRLERELTADRARLKERWEPAQMLPYWLALLESDRSRSDLAQGALKDAQRVQNDASAKPEDKARALAIEGLVKRNEEQFAAAEATLKKAQAALAGSKGPWLVSVTEALREVSAPAAMFARQAANLAARGKGAEARAVLARGLKVVETKKGPLYAQRAALSLELARDRGPLNPSNTLVASVREDAQAAAAEGVAEGHYLLGQVAEDLGQLSDAVTSYRAAVKAHEALDEQGSLYRVALARALLKSQSSAAPPPVERTSKATGTPRRVSALEMLKLLVTLTLQAEGLPGGKGVQEAEKLADEILAAGDKVPFDVRAQALAVKGLYSRALATYTAGLREKGLLAPRYANTLLELINSHPGLRRSESMAANPAAGERHYAAGLNYFTARRYSSAEKEFLSAIENDNSDARYYYFLGLSRLAQGKREAYEDFDQAAHLEQLGRPSRAAVSAALERVQGPMRRMLNSIRTRPVKEQAK
jgi:hypothetical protein